jgi:hypothetical protein
MVLSRSEAMATLGLGHRQCADLLARLSGQELSRPRTIGNGAWSAKDLVSHFTFWEELAVRTVEDCRAARRPFVEGIFDGGSEALDAANEDHYNRTAHLPAEEVLRSSEAVHLQLLRMVAAMGYDEWNGPLVYDSPHKPTLGELLGSVLGAPGRPFKHAESHLSDLQQYVHGLRHGGPSGVVQSRQP